MSKIKMCIIVLCFTLTFAAVSQDMQDMTSVKFLYIVPRDRVAREDYAEWIGKMAYATRGFFHYHLGKWMKFSDPLLEKIDSPLSVEDIVYNGESSMPYLNIYNHIVGIINEQFSTERVNGTLFVGIVINDFGGFAGGGGIASVGTPGFKFWEGAFSFAPPNEVPGRLSVLYHEVGHALGLAHAQDTLTCLVKILPGIDEFDDMSSTFMSQSRAVTNIWPQMSTAEKLLLLNDEQVYKDCLLTLGDRVHPSQYFSAECTSKIPPGNLETLARVLVNFRKECDSLYCPDYDCDGMVGLNEIATLLVRWS